MTTWTVAELTAEQSRKQVRTKLKAGHLHRVVPGIYSDEKPDDRLVLMALHDHRGLVYTGSTAMDLYLDRPVAWPVQARHPGASRRTTYATIRTGVPQRLRENGSLTLVSPIQAAVDADLPDVDLRNFLADAYHSMGAQHVLEEDLGALVKGRKQAMALLEGTPIGAMSKLERRAFGIICEALADLPVTVLVNRMVGNYCYDLVIPEAKVAVEIDSYMYHAAGGTATSVGSYVKNTWKGNEVTHLGWVLCRYTNYCINEASHMVARDIRQAVLPRIKRKADADMEPQFPPVWFGHPAARR